MRSVDPPSPLTDWQRRILWIAAFLTALTRVYAMARSPWDWDEMQFAWGVREYDVGGAHHPHPPGFPLFMLAANLVRPFLASDFRAVQFVSLIAACALFPLAFALARELRFPFVTSLMGAVVFVFFPNVWFFGGTAFSDISGVAASLAAAWLLLRGRWSPRAYLGGAVMLGIAAGIRSQTLLFGAAPFLLASLVQLRMKWQRVLAAVLIVIAIPVASYIGAAIASSSIEQYGRQVEGTREWVRKIDSFLAPGRESLSTLGDEFFLRPQGGNRLPVVVAILAAIALVASPFVQPRAGVWIAFAIFAPFAVFAWLMLDPHSVHRYSTAYLLLWALLAAHGAGVLAMPLRRWGVIAQVVLLALVAGRAAYWTLPGLQQVREQNSPPFEAIQWLRARVPQGERVWVHGSLQPFAEYYLHDRELHLVRENSELPRRDVRANDYYASEGAQADALVTFAWPHERLWDIARRRWFETSIVRLASLWTFGEGWYGHESDGHTHWQWMGARSEALLPAVGGRARLSLTLLPAPQIAPEIEVSLNGVVLERFSCGDQPVTRSWIVDARADTPNVLVLRASATTRVPGDPRDLSVQLRNPRWEPLR